MSNREALRKLTKRFPPVPEVKQILADLRGDSDRSIAIVGTALLESFLERLLLKCMTHQTPDLIGQAFHNRGPLSGFHSKILIASAFGFVAPVLGEELQAFRAIRNAFAHSKIAVTFNTPEIEATVRSFAFLQIMASVEGPSTDWIKKMEPKAIFLLILNICLFLVDLQCREAGGDRVFPLPDK